MLTAPLLALALAAAPYTPAPPEQVPGYFARPIAAGDLQGKGLRDLAILRNTIYARWGWDGYRKQWLRDYFHAQSWFKPNPDFKYTLVSELDRKNAHAIGLKEAGFTRSQLEDMELAIFRSHRVSFNDVPTWKFPDGSTVRSCEDAVADPKKGPAERVQGNPDTSRDCRYRPAYKADPKSTLATLPLEARTELGLIQRAMGFFTLDDSTELADPNALDKQLKVADLRQLSGRDLRILRNTIYARRGRSFKSPVLREYFEQKDWYKPDPRYTDARLTPVDQRNVTLIKSVEEELGGPISDDEQQKSLQDANFDGA